MTNNANCGLRNNGGVQLNRALLSVAVGKMSFAEFFIQLVLVMHNVLEYTKIGCLHIKQPAH